MRRGQANLFYLPPDMCFVSICKEYRIDSVLDQSPAGLWRQREAQVHQTSFERRVIDDRPEQFLP